MGTHTSRVCRYPRIPGTSQRSGIVGSRGQPVDDAHERRTGMQIDGRVAVVTGGGSGIGRAMCESLGARGARVVVADLNLEHARQTAAGLGSNAVAAQCDVTDAGDLAAAI